MSVIPSRHFLAQLCHALGYEVWPGTPPDSEAAPTPGAPVVVALTTAERAARQHAADMAMLPMIHERRQRGETASQIAAALGMTVDGYKDLLARLKRRGVTSAPLGKNASDPRGRKAAAMITMPDGRRLLLRDAAAELGISVGALRCRATRVGAGEWTL